MFPIVSNKNYAVITGDIIGSSDLTAPERKQLPNHLRAAATSLTDFLGEEVVAPLAIFGGDSWQLLLARPELALRAALWMRASLLASPLDIDTRMAIAVAGVDFVPDQGIEEADGEAFRLSGRMLAEGMSKRRTLRFATPDSGGESPWDIVCQLIDALIHTNWNENRARAVSGALRGWKSKPIGELWSPPITRQSVERHLDEAGWPAIEAALVQSEQMEPVKNAAQ